MRKGASLLFYYPFLFKLWLFKTLFLKLLISARIAAEVTRSDIKYELNVVAAEMKFESQYKSF